MLQVSSIQDRDFFVRHGLAWLFLCLFFGSLSQGRENVELVPLARSVAFDEGMVPWAVTHSCAASQEILEEFLVGQGHPFLPHLVKRLRKRYCHIFYQPSVPGFRASPDNSEIRELHFNYDAVRFLSKRSTPLGDTLDVIKSILARIDRPIAARLALDKRYEEGFYARAHRHHFGDSRWDVSLEDSGPDSYNPWAQDFMKGGSRGGSEMNLVPYRLYEGDHQNGRRFQPLLDSLSRKRYFARSRLSWEGGDLQFLKSPRNPSELTLFYGNTARTYWGDSLSGAEFAHILQREFGADHVVDLSAVAPHIDYFVLFLPRAAVALVSDPMTGNRELAQAALALLERHFQDKPPPQLQALSRVIRDPSPQGGPRILRNLDAARRASQSWQYPGDPVLNGRLESYVTAHCATDVGECLSLEGRNRMLRGDWDLFSDQVDESVQRHSDQKLIAGLLSVIESQFREVPADLRERTEDRIRQLETLGFRVIRVPRLAGWPELGVPWSGISYVNGLLVDETLFMPSFGLGEAEEVIFERLQAQLGAAYEVVPIFARELLVNNGGVHCITGIVR